MDAQDKKSKDWTLFGRTEDNAIARAKYKREMGINPKAKTESSAEVSRSAKSMKNPTSRPYDPKDSAKVAALRKKEPDKASGGSAPVNKGSGNTRDEEAVRQSMVALDYEIFTDPKNKRQFDKGFKTDAERRNFLNRNVTRGSVREPTQRPYDVKTSPSSTSSRTTFGSRTSGPGQKRPSDKKPASAASGAPPKPKQKPASDKSSQPGKMTSFQRMKARQFEKEGVAGRSMSRSAAQKKAMEKVGTPKMSGLLSKLSSGTKKAAAPKKVDKPAGKSKSELAAWFRSKRQGLAK